MRSHLDAILQLAPVVPQEYYQKLQERANRLMASARIALDQDLLTREVALLADRCDVSEEVVRLGSHLEQFVHLCDGQGSAGRKLDFVAQEMLREANTISSKSNNAEIAKHVVDLKVSIGRLKEQVQNVE
jgi:uncharacterized protein (TIGR00255 family)